MSFSLISPTSVKLLNIEAGNVCVILDHLMGIIVWSANGYCRFLFGPPSDDIVEHFPTWTLLNESFSMRRCVENLLVALDLLEIDMLFVMDEDAIYNELKGIKLWKLVMGENNPTMFDLYYRDVMNISIADRALLGEQFRALVSENLDRLELTSECVIGLDDLLSCNAKDLKIEHPFSLSDLNLFLRHLINGLNPRLAEAHISLAETLCLLKKLVKVHNILVFSVKKLYFTTFWCLIFSIVYWLAP